jgi:16S rRNA (cytosine1402-N4)-methyltransferase
MMTTPQARARSSALRSDGGDAGHVPVMVAEVLHWLAPRPGALYVDATVGLGGHATAILRSTGGAANVIGLDQDPEALATAAERLRSVAVELGRPDAFRLTRANFQELPSALADLGFGGTGCDGILFDLGVSSLQLDRPERGFSFRAEGPLDMRMDPGQSTTAADLINERSERELADILFYFGEERFARRIARRIVDARQRQPFRTTRELAEVVRRAVPGKGEQRLDPATRTFQALRIAVNRELEVLEPALRHAREALAPGGRLVALAYHSLEDRIVKRTFEWLSGRCRCPPEVPTCQCGATRQLAVLTRKPISPTKEETRANPRSRSAKLRAAERVEG